LILTLDFDGLFAVLVFICVIRVPDKRFAWNHSCRENEKNHYFRTLSKTKSQSTWTKNYTEQFTPSCCFAKQLHSSARNAYRYRCGRMHNSALKNAQSRRQYSFFFLIKQNAFINYIRKLILVQEAIKVRKGFSKKK
jgi:hypothetical protein